MLPRWTASVGLSLLAAVLGVVVLFDDATSWLVGGLDDRTGGAQWALVIGLRLVALGCLVLALLLLHSKARGHWRSKQGFDKAPGRPMPERHVDVGEHNAEILDAMTTVAERYDSRVTSLFGRILIADADYHVRITEEAAAVGEMLRSTVTVTFAAKTSDLEGLRQAGTHAIVVPMLKASIGTMLDNVDPVDGSGCSVPMLSQRDTRGLVAIVLKGLFADAFGTDHPDAENALWALRRLVCRVGRIPAADWDHHFDLATRTIGRPDDDEKFDRLQRFCRFFAVNYVLVAEVAIPPGNEWILKYVRMMPLYGRADSADNRMRIRLGLDAYGFNIPMNLAFSAASYHFWMYLGPRMYVKLHYVRRQSGETVRQADVGSMGKRAYLRVRHRQALPYAHLYTRGLHQSEPQDLVMVVNFGEVPPGTLGVAAGLALLSTITILLFGLTLPYGDRASGDILALVLAVPGFVATFVGYSMDRVQRSSLTTLSGLVAVGAVSFAAGLLYVFQDTPGWIVTQHALLGMTMKVNSVLFVLLVISIANCCNLFWRLHNEMTHYSALLAAQNTVGMMFR